MSAKSPDTGDGWQFSEYVSTPCDCCGRVRVMLCDGGKHRCEKCNWCPEDEQFVQSDEDRALAFLLEVKL